MLNVALGAVAQRERASLAWKRSGVQVPPAPPEITKAVTSDIAVTAFFVYFYPCKFPCKLG